jgi:hypothetical protein
MIAEVLVRAAYGRVNQGGRAGCRAALLDRVRGFANRSGSRVRRLRPHGRRADEFGSLWRDYD